MNKELIKKYKAEFDHWLNGGTLLYRHFNYIEQEFTAWEVCNAGFSWNSSGINCPRIIINDEYVELRKALAEGKKIEVLDVDGKWKDTGMTSSSRAFIYPLKDYRIKPEEPKFRVGDWLVEIHSGDFAKVLNVYKKDIRVHLIKSNSIITTESTDFTHWQPKKGEWCWWFSTKNRIPTIGQFLSIETDSNRKYAATFPNTPHPFISYYDYCEPFLGQLPTNLQEPK